MSALLVKWLGPQDYQSTWQKMRDFTDTRDASTGDELWLLEHQAVFTLGQAGKEHHLLNPGDIPIVKTDRGGQVTFHGPGQLVGYLLVDIKRKKLGIRDMVTGIEQSVIRFLDSKGIHAVCREGAPGVYVNDQKISALGLRIRKGCSYHGFSLNVNMDLSVFGRINPCGYEGLEVTDLASLGIQETTQSVGESLAEIIAYQFGYDAHPVN